MESKGGKLKVTFDDLFNTFNLAENESNCPTSAGLPPGAGELGEFNLPLKQSFGDFLNVRKPKVELYNPFEQVSSAVFDPSITQSYDEERRPLMA